MGDPEFPEFEAGIAAASAEPFNFDPRPVT